MPADVIAQALASRLPAAAPAPSWLGSFSTGLTLSRQYGMAASDGSRLYVVGGTTDGTNGTASAEVISSTGVRSSLPTMPGAAMDGVAAFIGGKLVVTAFRSATNSTGTRATYIYTPAGSDGASGTWTQGALLPVGLAFAAGCAGSDGALWVVGGSTSTSGNGVVTSVYRYDVAANTWSQPSGASLPNARYYGTLIPVGNQLWYCAASTNGNIFQDVLILNVNNPAGGWNYGANLPGTMNLPIGVSIGGQPYIFTGASTTLTSYTLWTLPTGSSAWQQVSTACPTAHAYGVGAVIGSRLILASGSNISTATQIDPSGNNLAAKIRALQQYLAATDPVAYSAARKLAFAIPPVGLSSLSTLSPTYQEHACSTDGVNIYLSHGLINGAFGVAAYSRTLTAPSSQSVLPNASFNRRYCAGAFLAGKHYAVGGMNSGSSMTAQVEAYTPAAGAWSNVTSLPQSRGYVSLAVAQGLLWAYNGTGTGAGNGNGPGELWSYNPSTNQWTTRTTSPTNLYGGALVAVGNFLYHFGGRDTNENIAQVVMRYDLTLGTWSFVTSSPPAMGRCRGVAIGGKVYLIAEQNPTTVLAFDVATATFSTPLTAPSSSRGHTSGVVALGNTLAVLGGAGRENGFDVADLSALVNYPPAASAVKALTAIGGRAA